MFLGAIEWFCLDSGQRDGMIMSDIWLLNNETGNCLGSRFKVSGTRGGHF